MQKFISRVREPMTTIQSIEDLMNKVVEFFYQDDFNKAEEIFLMVLKINPRYIECYFNLGKLYELKGDFLKAEKVYKDALAVNSKNINILISLIF